MNKNTIDKIIQLRKTGMTYSAISEELGVNKSIISYHCQKLPNNKEIIESNLPYEIVPETTVELIKKLVSVRCTHGELSMVTGLSMSRVKQVCLKIESKPQLNSHYDVVRNRRKRLKLLAVITKGGKCEICGYNKYLSALDFHHIDPSTKSFAISTNTSKSWEKVRKEIEKCVLVCATCHREIHAVEDGDWNIQTFYQ